MTDPTGHPAPDLQPFAAVIFDCDGVLIDSEPISARTLVRCLDDFNCRIDEAYVYRHYLGRSFATIEADFQTRLGVPMPDTFLAHWQEHLFAAFRAGLRPLAGITDLLQRLRVPYAVVSSSAPARLGLCLQLAALDGYFGDRVFNAAMVRHGKPAPDLFLLAAERLAVDPQRSLAIEDSVSGIKAARAAGMTVWG